MKNYFKLFWLVPVIALLFPLLMMIIMSTAPRSLGATAAHIYQVMFFITPAVGVVVLFSLLVLLIIPGAMFKQVQVGRTIAFALLDVISPVVFLFLGMVLSGFTR
jgi:hypothetical protein